MIDNIIERCSVLIPVKDIKYKVLDLIFKDCYNYHNNLDPYLCSETREELRKIMLDILQQHSEILGLNK